MFSYGFKVTKLTFPGKLELRNITTNFFENNIPITKAIIKNIANAIILFLSSDI
jgi:hypothetical protein